MVERTIRIDKCMDCPCIHLNPTDVQEAAVLEALTKAGRPWAVCMIDKKPMRDPTKVHPTEKGPPPGNCPLRTQPVTIRLTASMEPS